jgi:HD superfamily phosphodiesterase
MSANTASAYDTLVTTIRDFVDRACAGRDESHGLPHMEAVYESSIKIFDQLFDPSHPDYEEFRLLTTICAWLHDVPDHKYDPDGKLKELCCAFLADELSLDQPTIGLVMGIIDRVSFSKENKATLAGNPPDFDEIFGKHAVIRHIVSDADKDQAIGEIGIVRCAQYTMERNPGIDRATLKEDIVIHFHEKLGRLYMEFIRTAPGKELARPNHERMVEIIDDLDTFLDARSELFQHSD